MLGKGVRVYPGTREVRYQGTFESMSFKVPMVGYFTVVTFVFVFVFVVVVVVGGGGGGGGGWRVCWEIVFPLRRHYWILVSHGEYVRGVACPVIYEDIFTLEVVATIENRMMINPFYKKQRWNWKNNILKTSLPMFIIVYSYNFTTEGYPSFWCSYCWRLSPSKFGCSDVLFVWT